MSLHSSPSKGIWLECGHAAQTALLHRLDEAGEGVFISQEERMACLMLDLLLGDEPIPIGRFCTRYDVTRNTIVSDVALAENLLAEHRLAIERTRRGIKLKAGEQSGVPYWKALFMSNWIKPNMLQIVQGVALRRKPDTFAVYVLDRLLESVVDVNMLFVMVANIVRISRRELGATLSESRHDRGFIRLCIAIQRCRSASGSAYPLPADCADAPQIRLMIAFYYSNETEAIIGTVSDILYGRRFVVHRLASGRACCSASPRGTTKAASRCVYAHDGGVDSACGARDAIPAPRQSGFVEQSVRTYVEPHLKA